MGPYKMIYKECICKRRYMSHCTSANGERDSQLALTKVREDD